MIINKLNKENRGMAQKNLFSTQPSFQKTVSFHPSATGGASGGMFGKTNEPKSPTLGLFGAKSPSEAKQTANPVGLFGGAKKESPTKTGGLFAPKDDKPATGGLFAPKTGTTGGGLFAPKTETTPATGGLFGPKPATSGLFTPATTTGGLFGPKTGTTGMFGGGAGIISPTTPADQDNKNLAEIEVVMQNYAALIDPTNAKNSFTYCMYNKYGPNINPQFKEQIKRLVPIKDIAVLPENTKITGEPTGTKKIEVFIDQKDFSKCKRENPNSDDYYVKQINMFLLSNCINKN